MIKGSFSSYCLLCVLCLNDGYKVKTDFVADIDQVGKKYSWTFRFNVKLWIYVHQLVLTALN